MRGKKRDLNSHIRAQALRIQSLLNPPESIVEEGVESPVINPKIEEIIPEIIIVKATGKKPSKPRKKIIPQIMEYEEEEPEFKPAERMIKILLKNHKKYIKGLTS